MRNFPRSSFLSLPREKGKARNSDKRGEVNSHHCLLKTIYSPAWGEIVCWVGFSFQSLRVTQLTNDSHLPFQRKIPELTGLKSVNGGKEFNKLHSGIGFRKAPLTFILLRRTLSRWKRENSICLTTKQLFSTNFKCQHITLCRRNIHTHTSFNFLIKWISSTWCLTVKVRAICAKAVARGTRNSLNWFLII